MEMQVFQSIMGEPSQTPMQWQLPKRDREEDDAEDQRKRRPPPRSRQQGAKGRGRGSGQGRNQSQEQVVQLVAQLALRHEDQLQLVRQDTGFVLFLRIQTPLSVLPQLHQVGQTWVQQKDKDPSSPGLPLRVVLLGSFLTALKTRVERVMTDSKSAEDSKKAQLLTDKGHFNFLGRQGLQPAAKYGADSSAGHLPGHHEAARADPTPTIGDPVPRVAEAHRTNHGGSPALSSRA